MTIQLKNHVSGKCLYVYSNSYVSTTTCDSIDTTQQWTWSSSQLQSNYTSSCLSVSSTSAASTLRLYTCDPSDTKQHWQYNNTVITSEYYSDYALTDSPISTYVDLGYSGRNYFQYWEDGTNTAPVSPTIISLKNHVSGKCLYAYYSIYISSDHYVKTTACDNTDATQQWAWFDNYLQSIGEGLCLSVDSSSSTGTLRLNDCNPADTKQHWQYNNTVITSEYYSDYALTDSPISTYVDLDYSGRNYF